MQRDRNMPDLTTCDITIADTILCGALIPLIMIHIINIMYVPTSKTGAFLKTVTMTTLLAEVIYSTTKLLMNLCKEIYASMHRQPMMAPFPKQHYD